MTFTMPALARSLADYLAPVLPGVTFYEDPNQQDSAMPCAFLQQRFSRMEKRTGGQWLRTIGLDLTYLEDYNLVDLQRRYQKAAEALDLVLETFPYTDGAASTLLRRGTDFFARYGGEEFVALILGGNGAADFAHLKRVRQAVEDLHIPHNPEFSPWVTISIGGITVVPKVGDSYDTYLKLADTMLYDAKRFGRNRVVWTNEKMEQWQEK